MNFSKSFWKIICFHLYTYFPIMDISLYFSDELIFWMMMKRLEKCPRRQENWYFPFIHLVTAKHREQKVTGRYSNVVGTIFWMNESISIKVVHYNLFFEIFPICTIVSSIFFNWSIFNGRNTLNILYCQNFLTNFNLSIVECRLFFMPHLVCPCAYALKNIMRAAYDLKFFYAHFSTFRFMD